MTPAELDAAIDALPAAMGAGPFLLLCGLVPLIIVCFAVMALAMGGPKHTASGASLGPRGVTVDADWDGYTGSFVGPEWMTTGGSDE